MHKAAKIVCEILHARIVSVLTLIPVCLMRCRFKFSLVDRLFPHSGQRKLLS